MGKNEQVKCKHHRRSGDVKVFVPIKLIYDEGLREWVCEEEYHGGNMSEDYLFLGCDDCGKIFNTQHKSGVVKNQYDAILRVIKDEVEG